MLIRVTDITDLDPTCDSGAVTQKCVITTDETAGVPSHPSRLLPQTGRDLVGPINVGKLVLEAGDRGIPRQERGTLRSECKGHVPAKGQVWIALLFWWWEEKTCCSFDFFSFTAK